MVPFQQNWSRVEAEGAAVLLYCVLRTVDSDSEDAARSIGEAVAQSGLNRRRPAQPISSAIIEATLGGRDPFWTRHPDGSPFRAMTIPTTKPEDTSMSPTTIRSQPKQGSDNALRFAEGGPSAAIEWPK